MFSFFLQKYLFFSFFYCLPFYFKKHIFTTETTYNIICYFRYIVLIRNIFHHLKIRYDPSADFYEIRNTVTDKFAFCDGTLIVAMVTLQEPYFPKHFFSYISI